MHELSQQEIELTTGGTGDTAAGIGGAVAGGITGGFVGSFFG